MNRRLIYWLLGLVIVLSAFLRFWQLNQMPISLFGDEIDVGYHAFSILKTGKDYLGQPWPVYFHSLAEWRAPLFIYSVVPSVAVFGLNEWGVRIPAAFFGVMSIAALFFLTRKLLSSFWVAILASLFLTISPWHLQYSRAGFEVSLMLFLLISGTLFLIKGIKENTLFLVPSAILLALAPYTYSTASVFLPLLMILFVFVFRNKILKIKLQRSVVLSITVFFIVLLPLGREIFLGQAAGRFQFLSVFGNTKLVGEINLSRKESLAIGDSLNQISFGERLLHNRVLSWTQAIGNNYLQAFSTDFLFINGDPNNRHSIGKMGELYWTDLIFIILGLFSLIKLKIAKENKIFLVGWLILAPVASSLTIDGGTHASRLFLMLPPLMILSALGAFFLVGLFENKKKKLVIGIITVLILINFVAYAYRYWVHYPKDSWRWWYLGSRESMVYIKDHQNDYPVVVMNDTYNHSLLYFLFWNAYSPEKFRQEFKGDVYQKDILPGIDGFRLGKFYFGNLSDQTKQTMGFVKVIKPGMLYLISQKDEVGGSWDWRTDHPNEIVVLRSVTNPSGEPIYYIVTAKQL